MPDSDIPSVVEDDEEEATMMWNREEFDPEGDLLASGGLESALDAPPAAREDPAGLNAADLFEDVLGEEGAGTAGGLASERLVDERGTPSISAGPVPPEGQQPVVEVHMPKTTSLVAPAPPSRTGLWVALVGLTTVVLALGAYAMRAQLGPVEAWIDAAGLPQLLGPVGAWLDNLRLPERLGLLL